MPKEPETKPDAPVAPDAPPTKPGKAARRSKEERIESLAIERSKASHGALSLEDARRVAAAQIAEDDAAGESEK